MKFLVPNYSCLQNPWLRGYRPQIPVLSDVCPQLNLLNPLPEQNSWVRHRAQQFTCEMDYIWGTNIGRCTAHQFSVVSVLGCLCNGNQKYNRWNMMLIVQFSYLESDQLKSRLGTNCLDRFLWCGPLEGSTRMVMLWYNFLCRSLTLYTQS